VQVRDRAIQGYVDLGKKTQGQRGSGKETDTTGTLERAWRRWTLAKGGDLQTQSARRRGGGIVEGQCTAVNEKGSRLGILWDRGGMTRESEGRPDGELQKRSWKGVGGICAKIQALGR